MEFIDTLIGYVSPKLAASRIQERMRYQGLKAYYEATRPSRTRKNKGDNNSQNNLTSLSAEALRGQARHLDQNHDIAKGILRELTNKTVGSNGIQVESLARTPQGEIAIDFVSRINELWKEWCEICDASGELSYARAQRMSAWSKYRDGEAFGRSLMGNVPGLTHATGVKLTMQYLEADFVPFKTDESKSIYQGIKRNDWGKAIDFLVYKVHPTETFQSKFLTVPANSMNHMKTIDRLGQARGVSIFAASLNRLNDLKDYEDYERIAAKIGAGLAAYVKKGDSSLYDDDEGDEDDDRSIDIQSGMVFDGLRPGEEIGTIESNRPSQLLQPFRDSMLKAVVTGAGAGYSPVSKTYDGNYSARRQANLDDWANYDVLQDDFIGEEVRPTFQRFVRLAILSGAVSPRGVDPKTIYDADYRGPVMPWIDPKKEAEAHLVKLAARLTSPQAVMRKSGENPQEVMTQIKAFMDMLDKYGLQEPEYLVSNTDTSNDN